MSRIAKYPVALPSGVEAQLSAESITVKVPLGSLSQSLTGEVTIANEAGQLVFKVVNDSRHAKAMS